MGMEEEEGELALDLPFPLDELGNLPLPLDAELGGLPLPLDAELGGLPLPLDGELGLGKGRELVGLTAANANADVVTWLILTVGVAFAEIGGRG